MVYCYNFKINLFKNIFSQLVLAQTLYIFIRKTHEFSLRQIQLKVKYAMPMVKLISMSSTKL